MALRFDWLSSMFPHIIQAMRKTKLTKKSVATKAPVKAKVKTKPSVTTTAKPKRAAMLPLATGQIWRVGEQNLQVGLIGKLLVHYKLAAPNAIRISNSVGGRTAVEKYLKTNKAVLIKTVPADTVKF